MAESLDSRHGASPRSRQEIPTRNRFFWGLGAVTSTLTGSLFSLANMIYLTALNFNPALVSVAISLPQYAAFVTGPTIGHLSDNTRSRWGRRKPWMFWGVIFCAIFCMTLWHAPRPRAIGGWDWLTFGYLAGMLLLSSLAAASFGISWSAMGFEMTTDYNERTDLFKWGSYCGAIAGFVSPWFFWMCLKFEGGRAQTLKGSEGVIYVAIIMAGIILITGLPSILFCREKVAEHRTEKKVPFLIAVRATLHNKPFWLLVVSNFIMRFGMNVTGNFFPLIFLYHFGHGDQALGSACRAIMYNSISVASFAATSPIAALTNRIGKKNSLLFSLVMSALAYGTIWFTFTNVPGAYLKIHFPWSAPGYLLTFQWPSLITGVLIGVFTNTMPMVKASMLADVCDYDELKSGHRQEAFYNSVFGTSENIANAVSMTLQGLLLVASGFNSRLNIQSPHTILFWLLALVITQPLGFLIGICSILAYPLSRERMHAIRAEIDSRKNGGMRLDAGI